METQESVVEGNPSIFEETGCLPEEVGQAIQDAEPVVQEVAEASPAIQEPAISSTDARIAILEEQIRLLKEMPKNHRPSRANQDRKYEVVLGEMPKWGKVPAQQAELADIIACCFEPGSLVSEAEMFEVLAKFVAKFPDRYPQCARSVQDVTYLFRYYRGLKNDGKRAGFIARGFLRVK